MRIIQYLCKACLMVVVVAIAAGCNRGGDDVEKNESAIMAATEADSPNPPGRTDSEFTIRIIPDIPRSPDVLSVISLEGVPAESYRWEINDRIVEGENGASLPPGLARKGDTVSVTAAAGELETRGAVRIVNSPPRVLELPFSPADFSRGVDITVTPRAEDPDDDSVSFDYLWLINDEEISWERGATLPGESFKRGDRLALQVTPFDGEDYGKVFQSRSVVVPNAPPKFVSTPPESFKARKYHYQAQAEDPDDDTLTYRLATVPAGMTIKEESGEIDWTIGDDQAGEHRVRIEVQDETGALAYQEYSITISLPDQVIN